MREVSEPGAPVSQERLFGDALVTGPGSRIPGVEPTYDRERQIL